eukprot:TRINITY_DN53989_c0_g1_i1.p1 TRINITY_DN53989_c0_g1~~TRINITY_DN53989_c0_g1_i1.p1  ORF type:complete len:388 (-),score=62.47 TRINITY_DN53989_c0_g1_i1:14-1177(-)
MAFDVRVQENSVKVVVTIRDPRDIDISEKMVCVTSGDERFSCPLPVMVYPPHPLNTSKYNPHSQRLVLHLRRPFARETWKLFEVCEESWQKMNQEARRILGPEVDRGIDVQGAVQDENTLDVRVEEGKGVVVNLEAKNVDPAAAAHVVLGDDPRQDQIFLPFAAEADADSSEEDGACAMDGDDEASSPLSRDVITSGDSASCRRAASRIARQARKRGLWIGPSRTKRRDGRAIKGQSVFAARTFKAGDFVVWYKGRILQAEEKLRKPRARRFYFMLDSACTIDGGTGGLKPQAAHIAAYLNCHSGCVGDDENDLEPTLTPVVDPTKGLGNHTIRMEALRDIAAGEELFFDYGDRHKLDSVSSESSGEDEVYKLLATMQGPAPLRSHD